jgi:hypothetical protein
MRNSNETYDHYIARNLKLIKFEENLNLLLNLQLTFINKLFKVLNDK